MPYMGYYGIDMYYIVLVAALRASSRSGRRRRVNEHVQPRTRSVHEPPAA